MLGLHRGSCDVLLAIDRQFDRRRSRMNSAIATVVADPVDVGIVVDHGGVIGVVNLVDIYVVHGGVVVEAIAIPASAFVAESAVTEAVIYAAIEADMFTPISAVPKVRTTSPTPVTRSPEVSNLRRDDPGSGNPVVVFLIVVVGPIAGSPDVAISGANRLLIHGYRRRGKTDRNTHGDLRGCGGRNGRDRR